jgi:hypothetical protein
MSPSSQELAYAPLLCSTRICAHSSMLSAYCIALRARSKMGVPFSLNPTKSPMVVSVPTSPAEVMKKSVAL